MRTALIVGVTGLVGTQLLDQLIADPNYEKIIVLARKPIRANSPKVEAHVIDFEQISQYKDLIKADDLFCCLGTTKAQAGSNEAFYKVDFTYVHEIGKIAAANQTKQFILISSMGADSKSMIFYSKTKGEIEKALAELPFAALHIVRPSLLLGERKGTRMGEDLGKAFDKYLGFLIPLRYKGIHAAQVAKAMRKIALSEKTGVSVYESDFLARVS